MLWNRQICNATITVQTDGFQAISVTDRGKAMGRLSNVLTLSSVRFHDGSKNTLGRSVTVKSVMDVEDGRTFEDGSPRHVCIARITTLNFQPLYKIKI